MVVAGDVDDFFAAETNEGAVFAPSAAPVEGPVGVEAATGLVFFPLGEVVGVGDDFFEVLGRGGVEFLVGFVEEEAGDLLGVFALGFGAEKWGFLGGVGKACGEGEFFGFGEGEAGFFGGVDREVFVRVGEDC